MHFTPYSQVLSNHSSPVVASESCKSRDQLYMYNIYIDNIAISFDFTEKQRNADMTHSMHSIAT